MPPHGDDLGRSATHEQNVKEQKRETVGVNEGVSLTGKGTYFCDTPPWR